MRRLSLAAVLSLAVACQSTTTPQPPAELFKLTSVDGRPLPTTRDANPPSNGAVILGETLVFGTNGVATRRTIMRETPTSTPMTTIVNYAYTRSGDVVTLENVLCGPAALCIQHFPEQGAIDGDDLTLRPVPSLLPTAGSVLVYRRMLVLPD